MLEMWLDDLEDDLGKLLDGIEAVGWKALLILLLTEAIVQSWRYSHE